MYGCQWSGVEMHTTSIDLSARISRKSRMPLAAPPGCFFESDRHVQVAIEDVAHGGDFEVLLPHGVAEVGAPHLSHADKRGGDTVVSAAHVAGKNLRSERDSGGGFKKVSSIGVHDVDYCMSLEYFGERNFERGIGGAEEVGDRWRSPDGVAMWATRFPDRSPTRSGRPFRNSRGGVPGRGSYGLREKGFRRKGMEGR